MHVKPHHYEARITWTGASEGATVSYAAYSRDWLAEVPAKAPLHGSADRLYRGNMRLHNPEDLLVIALSTCHLLWYLHLCADAGIAVVGYVDDARGTMTPHEGKVRFTEVVLRPQVTIASGDAELALALHEKAHAECYVANSVNFPVRHEASVEIGGPSTSALRAYAQDDKR
ncbi:MAG: OsmC family protein [Candidatus Eremiobacteraeota bacterium]|nr:OsmC family protein [Candidatus Eremiobacteraeota bacterium]